MIVLFYKGTGTKVELMDEKIIQEIESKKSEQKGAKEEAIIDNFFQSLPFFELRKYDGDTLASLSRVYKNIINEYPTDPENTDGPDTYELLSEGNESSLYSYISQLYNKNTTFSQLQS